MNLSVNALLMNFPRYIIKDILGHGTFGQVAKCWVAETNSFVAVKIIKNQPAYFQQALVEVSILTSVMHFSFTPISLVLWIIPRGSSFLKFLPPSPFFLAVK